jgi:hypothetical protein
MPNVFKIQKSSSNVRKTIIQSEKFAKYIKKSTEFKSSKQTNTTKVLSKSEKGTLL